MSPIGKLFSCLFLLLLLGFCARFPLSFAVEFVSAPNYNKAEITISKNIVRNQEVVHGRNVSCDSSHVVESGVNQTSGSTKESELKGYKRVLINTYARKGGKGKGSYGGSNMDHRPRHGNDGSSLRSCFFFVISAIGLNFGLII